jgi:hypothetical protein
MTNTAFIPKDGPRTPEGDGAARPRRKFSRNGTGCIPAKKRSADRICRLILTLILESDRSGDWHYGIIGSEYIR